MDSIDLEKLNKRENFIKKNFIDPARHNTYLFLEDYKLWFLPQLEICQNLVNEYQFIKKEFDKIFSEEYTQNYLFKNIAKSDKKLCQDVDLTYLWSYSTPTQLSTFSASQDGYAVRSELTKAMLIHAKLTFLKGLTSDTRFDGINIIAFQPLSTKNTDKAKTRKQEKANSELNWSDIFINPTHIHYILTLLIKQDFVAKHNQDSYIWLRQESTNLRTVVALCLTLHRKGYINFRNKTKAAYATMNQLNVRINETEFQGSKAETYYEKYKELFFFIPHAKKAYI